MVPIAVHTVSNTWPDSIPTNSNTFQTSSNISPNTFQSNGNARLGGFRIRLLGVWIFLWKAFGTCVGRFAIPFGAFWNVFGSYRHAVCIFGMCLELFGMRLDLCGKCVSVEVWTVLGPFGMCSRLGCVLNLFGMWRGIRQSCFGVRFRASSPTGMARGRRL